MDGLCQRYGVLPGAIRRDPEVHRMIAILSLGGKFDREAPAASETKTSDETESGGSDLAALMEPISGS